MEWLVDLLLAVAVGLSWWRARSYRSEYQATSDKAKDDLLEHYRRLYENTNVRLSEHLQSRMHG